MEKDKILENSRLENKGRDFYAMEVEADACKIASLVMVVLAFIYYSYEIFTGKGSNPAFYSLIAVFNAVMFGYKAIKIKERRALSAVTSGVWALLTVLLVLSYFGVL
ncbi:MAG: hypothetical protein J6Z03_09295 [Erysipelotrichaceae bacterium]|nr:hypothetical protein [Erysipelotrichaceae bacterium]